MSALPSAAAVAAGTELLERALGYTRGALALVTPEQLSSPTPCAHWRLADLLAHMDDSLRALHDAVVVGRVSLATPVADRCPDGPVDLPVVASLRQCGCSLLGAWSALEHDQPVFVGTRALPTSVVAAAGALEIAVHGWDVARACGSALLLPDDLAAGLLPHAVALIAPADRGVRFGDPVPVPAGRPESDRLLALTGRAPDWGL